MRPYPRRIKYEVGKRFHSYIIVSPLPTKQTDCGRTYTQWLCLCDCGVKFANTTKQIQKGRKSCGCLRDRSQFKNKSDREVIGNTKLFHYQAGAKRRGIPWDLPKDQFVDMLFSKCSYCEQEPYLLVKRTNHEALVNGVDRRDSSLGYSLENCVSCCKFCNFAKNSSTEEEFMKWIGRVKCLGL
jgi:hypothetical protein